MNQKHRSSISAVFISVQLGSADFSFTRVPYFARFTVVMENSDNQTPLSPSQSPQTADAVAPGDPVVNVGEGFKLESMPLQQVLEAILFSSDIPLSAGKLAQTLGLDSTRPVKQTVEKLNEIYSQRQAAYRIEERAGGFQLLTLPQYAEYIQRLVRK